MSAIGRFRRWIPDDTEPCGPGFRAADAQRSRLPARRRHGKLRGADAMRIAFPAAGKLTRCPARPCQTPRRTASHGGYLLMMCALRGRETPPCSYSPRFSYRQMRLSPLPAQPAKPRVFPVPKITFPALQPGVPEQWGKRVNPRLGGGRDAEAVKTEGPVAIHHMQKRGPPSSAFGIGPGVGCRADGVGDGQGSSAIVLIRFSPGRLLE